MSHVLLTAYLTPAQKHLEQSWVDCTGAHTKVDGSEVTDQQKGEPGRIELPC